MKVLVLSGGASAEREVSIRSGANMSAALQSAGHAVIKADPSASGFDLSSQALSCDVVIPALHGAGGEDGALQDQLERLGVAFLGSGSESSRLAFDKAKTKLRLVAGGILTPDWDTVNVRSYPDSHLTRRPHILKPLDGGSSIDTLIIGAATKPPVGLKEVWVRHDRMLLEELIAGREITVGVLGNEALPVILIVPPAGEEFDYDNKYNGRTQELAAPTQLTAEIQNQARELAVRVHNLIGCRHLSRTDIIIAPDGSMYVLEINTIPGLTEQSLFPKAAAAAGMNTVQLADRLVDLAIG